MVSGSQMAMLTESEITPRRARAEEHRTFAEETAFLLSFVIVVVLAMMLATLLVLEFLKLLPEGLSTVIGMSLAAFMAVIAWALFERAISLPSVTRGKTPVVRARRRLRTQS